MTHAENEPSESRTPRGVTYALTFKLFEIGVDAAPPYDLAPGILDG